jgi:hypothetical protein
MRFEFFRPHGLKEWNCSALEFLRPVGLEFLRPFGRGNLPYWFVERVTELQHLDASSRKNGDVILCHSDFTRLAGYLIVAVGHA